MNRIILLGRLVKDPEVNYTASDKIKTGFTLAVDRPFANAAGQREADFIPVIVWGKQAELIGNGMKKGQRALVEGRLQIRSYDAKDGTKKYIAEVVADHFEFIERKNVGAGENNSTETTVSHQGSAFDEMGGNFSEEIPF